MIVTLRTVPSGTNAAVLAHATQLRKVASALCQPSSSTDCHQKESSGTTLTFLRVRTKRGHVSNDYSRVTSSEYSLVASLPLRAIYFSRQRHYCSFPRERGDTREI